MTNETQHDEESFESWDDYWASHTSRTRRETETIRGVEVEIPHDLPLRFTYELETLAESESEEDIRHLVAELFGVDVFDDWVEAGMTAQEFQVVLVWGIAAGRGERMSPREAHQLVVEQGKARRQSAPNRATRRRRSSGSGGRSRPISGANTTSHHTN